MSALYCLRKTSMGRYLVIITMQWRWLLHSETLVKEMQLINISHFDLL